LAAVVPAMALARKPSLCNVQAVYTQPRIASEPIVNQDRPEASIDDCSDKNLEDEVCFRCAFCVQTIGKHSPIFMRDDHLYCTVQCRHKGPSSLFGNLQSLGRGRARRLSRSTSDSNTYSSWQSDSEDDESTEVESSFADADTGNTGPLRWIFNKVVSAIASRVPQGSLLRVASEVLLDEIVEHRAMQLAFDYIDYIPKVASMVGVNSMVFLEGVESDTYLAEVNP